MSTITASTQAPAIKDYPRGDSRTLNIQVNNSDGTAFNLTSCTVYFTLNASRTPSSDSTDSTAALKTSNSTFSSPTSGLATISLTNTLTSVLAEGTYYYDIQLKDASGNITSLGRNTFKVIDDVTTRTS